nr:cysteine dioxygenase family protein [uncultured Psychroserpens sp.]
MKSPESIQKLIQLLSVSSKEDYNKILNNFDFKSIDLALNESWSSQHYTRNCLYRDAYFELILLCWEQGQETAVHGHDGEDCWVYLLEGEMEEVFFSLNDNNSLLEVGSKKVIANELTFMNDKIGFHKLKNNFTGRSLSLHLYAKPIENCVFYDHVTQSFKDKILHYDTFKEVAVKS